MPHLKILVICFLIKSLSISEGLAWDLPESEDSVRFRCFLEESNSNFICAACMCAYLCVDWLTARVFIYAFGYWKWLHTSIAYSFVSSLTWAWLHDALYGSHSTNVVVKPWLCNHFLPLTSFPWTGSCNSVQAMNDTKLSAHVCILLSKCLALLSA